MSWSNELRKNLGNKKTNPLTLWEQKEIDKVVNEFNEANKMKNNKFMDNFLFEGRKRTPNDFIIKEMFNKKKPSVKNINNIPFEMRNFQKSNNNGDYSKMTYGDIIKKLNTKETEDNEKRELLKEINKRKSQKRKKDM